MTMRERLARALYETFARIDAEDRGEDIYPSFEYFCAHADEKPATAKVHRAMWAEIDAILAELREPTEGMVDTANLAMRRTCITIDQRTGSPVIRWPNNTDIFRAMIDHAIAEGRK